MSWIGLWIVNWIRLLWILFGPNLFLKLISKLKIKIKITKHTNTEQNNHFEQVFFDFELF